VQNTEYDSAEPDIAVSREGEISPPVDTAMSLFMLIQQLGLL